VPPPHTPRPPEIVLVLDPASGCATAPPRQRGEHGEPSAQTDTDTTAGPGRANNDWGYGKLDLTNSLTYLENQPASDTVAIASTGWNTRKRTLSVEATSSEAPAPTLRMQYSLDGGTTWAPAAGLAMTYSASTGRYAVSTNLVPRWRRHAVALS